MSFKSLFICLSSLMMTSGALAGYEGEGTTGGNGFSITSIRITDQGAKLAVTPTPAGCLGGTHWGEHFLVKFPQADAQGQLNGQEAKRFDALYSALLTAFSAGQYLNGVWYEDRTQPCNTGPNGLLIVEDVKIGK